MPRALKNKPLLRNDCKEYLQAFQILDQGRGRGTMGPSPISITEILGHCLVTGMPLGEESGKFMRVMMQLDNASLIKWHEKNK